MHVRLEMASLWHLEKPVSCRKAASPDGIGPHITSPENDEKAKHLG
jgi:hypothetical protein